MRWENSNAVRAVQRFGFAIEEARGVSEAVGVGQQSPANWICRVRVKPSWSAMEKRDQVRVKLVTDKSVRELLVQTENRFDVPQNSVHATRIFMASFTIWYNGRWAQLTTYILLDKEFYERVGSFDNGLF
jgi:hypothetical protein